MSRLLLVDDDPEITSALARGLRLHGYDAEAVNRFDHALDQLRDTSYTGAIVDVMLGSDSGLDLIRQARAAGASLPILMLSALSDVEHRAAGLEAGADDYIVKPFSFDELVARLKVQEKRVAMIRSEPAMLSNGRVLAHTTGQILLTEREHALLGLLIDHSGTPISRGAIFDALWQSEGSHNDNVVDVYIGYLRKKLREVDFGFEIKTKRNEGFVLEGVIPRRKPTHSD